MNKIMKFASLFSLVIVMFLMFGCSLGDQPHNQHDETEEQIVNNLLQIIPTQISDGLELPAVDSTTNIAITWRSANPSVLTDDGYLYAQDEATTVELIASFKINEETKEHRFTINVDATDESVFNKGYDTYIKDIPATTVKKINFYTRNLYGYTVNYKSLDESIALSDGTVFQNLESDRDAKFEITLTYGRTIKVYTKTITVLKYTDLQVAQEISRWVKTQITEYNNGTIDVLPTTHPEFGSIITWSTREYGAVAYNGVVTPPKEAKDINVSYNVSYKESIQSGSGKLLNVGGLTDEEWLEAYLSSLLPTTLISSVNYLTEPDKNGEQYLDHQTRSYKNGVLNLISGQPIDIDMSYFIDPTDETKPLVGHYFGSLSHPDVTQEFLDKKFGEGYQMPNEQNILYIVVHESGMPYEGSDAELLADIQYKNAYVDPGRQASWNYQVDGYKIYQSFDDNVVCWHAGDGSAPGTGNSNGIGIEMCINTDGSYDGSMQNDAKLIAYLMHKYNLGIENVQRHFDFSGKECPSYMIRTNRWIEMLNHVKREYDAIEVFEGATFKWTVSNMEYFEEGANGIYYVKDGISGVTVDVTLEYQKGDFEFSKTVTLEIK